MQQYKAGEILFRAGEPSTYLYILREGHVKLSNIIAGGREQILGLAKPGHLIGFHKLDDRVHPYDTTAMTASQVCKVRHKSILKLLQDHPSISIRIINALNDELEQSHALIRAIGHKMASEKVASLILSLSPEQDSSNEERSLILSRLELSEMLGLAEETVSRITAELKRSKIIEAPRGEIRILDRARLQQYLEGDATGKTRQA